MTPSERKALVRELESLPAGTLVRRTIRGVGLKRLKILRSRAYGRAIGLSNDRNDGDCVNRLYELVPGH